MTQYLSQLALARLYAASLFLGIALGMLYDLFRIRRIAFRHLMMKRAGASDRRPMLSAQLLVHIEDALFGVTAGVATAILYFAFSMGQVRIMAMLGEGAGFILYRLTLGKLVMACADAILRFLAAVFKVIVRLLILPPLRVLGRMIDAISAALLRTYRKLRERRLTRIGSKEALCYAQYLCQLASAGFSEQAVHRHNRLRVRSKQKKRNKKIKIEKG